MKDVIFWMLFIGNLIFIVSTIRSRIRANQLEEQLKSAWRSRDQWRESAYRNLDDMSDYSKWSRESDSKVEQIITHIWGNPPLDRGPQQICDFITEQRQAVTDYERKCAMHAAAYVQLSERCARLVGDSDNFQRILEELSLNGWGLSEHGPGYAIHPCKGAAFLGVGATIQDALKDARAHQRKENA